MNTFNVGVVDVMHMIVDSLSPPNVVRKVFHDHKHNKIVSYIDEFPNELQEFIVCIDEMKSDGNCHYQAIAFFLVWVRNVGLISLRFDSGTLEIEPSL